LVPPKCQGLARGSPHTGRCTNPWGRPRFVNVSDDDFFAVVNVHLVGTVRVLRAAYPHMREQGYGRIVTTSSASGLWGNFGQTSYATAKLAIAGFTHALSSEGAERNIKANVIAPVAATRMTEALLGDLASRLKPQLVSPLVAYLCHSSLEHSGHLISVGAGRFARVAIGVCPGVWNEEPTPEFVADNFDAIIGEEEMIFPEQAMGEMQLIFPEAR
jgi:NAD(P)-dependent dehydrogenase (short-subunit alcohol dehydrogenase family)